MVKKLVSKEIQIKTLIVLASIITIIICFHVGYFLAKTATAFFNHSSGEQKKVETSTTHQRASCADSCKVMEAEYVQYDKTQKPKYRCLCYITSMNKYIWIYDYNPNTSSYNWELVPE